MRLVAAAILAALAVAISACGDGDDVSPTPTGGSSATLTSSPGPGDSIAPTGAGTPLAPPSANAYHLETVLSPDDLGDAVGPAIELALIPGIEGEAVIALQNGLLYRVALDGSGDPQPWGDIHNLMPDVSQGSLGEQGLLSLAFSPDFADDGRAYLYYTRGSPGASVLSRFQARVDGLDVGSEEVLIEVPQFAANHNGGHIVFDHEGYLLLSYGDGGGGGDPEDNGQDPGTLLGSVIRIDVSPDSGYDIPPGNPFGNEVFAYGFRNPWRTSIDSLTGELWLGDVGQNAYEEVDGPIIAGANYGWNCYEGFAEYELTDACLDETFTEPNAAYDHDSGSTVTGGFVYRGAAMPELYGYYVYADFYTGRIWALSTDGGDPIQIAAVDLNVASFTELPDRELLIVSYSSGIFRLARD